MIYAIVSFDANHAQNVRYNIGTARYSELISVTAGTRTDNDGHPWVFTVPYSYGNGRKIQIHIDPIEDYESFLNNLGSVGLSSLDLAEDFMDKFPADNDNYYLQKNPTSTKEYPNMTYNNSSSESGGIIYTTRVLWPMNSSSTPNTLACTVTARSDDPDYSVSHYMSPLLILDNNDEPAYLGAVSVTVSPRFHFIDVQIVFNTDCEYRLFSNVMSVDSTTDPVQGEYSYDFEGDEIELPGAPDETVSGVLASGFLNIYRPSDTQLQAFGAALWTNLFNTKWYDKDNVANLILNAVSDPINFIVGLFMLPVSPDVGASSGIFLGGINVNTVSAPKVSSQFKTINFGTMNIEELYGNYLDYSHSQLSIYLPYVGVADIDVQEVNGGSITLQYTIDCFTGACVANVKCVKYTKTPWGKTYRNSTVHSYTGNVAIQLPISAGSFDTMLSGLINVGLGLGMNQPAKALQGVGDMINGMAGDVTTRGSLSSNTGKCCYQTPYLMFTRPIESRPANLGKLHGYSAGVGGALGSFHGYVECSDIKLDGIIATDAELNELRQLCIDGIYI